jgi:predicted DNA binding CopG/RHH family protein
MCSKKYNILVTKEVCKMDKQIAVMVSEELYKKVKVHVAVTGTTLKKYIADLIVADLEKQKQA